MVLSEGLDLSVLDEISPETEEALSTAMKRILAELRKLKEPKE